MFNPRITTKTVEIINATIDDGILFNFGDLVVQGAGRDNPEIKFIRDPLKMRNRIAEMLDASN